MGISVQFLFIVLLCLGLLSILSCLNRNLYSFSVFSSSMNRNLHSFLVYFVPTESLNFVFLLNICTFMPESEFVYLSSVFFWCKGQKFIFILNVLLCIGWIWYSSLRVLLCLNRNLYSFSVYFLCLGRSLYSFLRFFCA